MLSGSARGVVVNTGQRTYFGAITRKLAGQRSRTSFDKGISGFTWLMIRFMVVMVAVVFLIIGITKHNWVDALLFGLAVAVGLTPEMLPMIVTVNLAKGALAMSRKKVIVKRLNSIQNFGAIDILCTDKTGTLTQDKVVLEKHVDVTGRDSDDVLRYAYMNSFYQTGLRNLLDRAVLSHTEFEVERSCQKVDEIPFDFTRKRMSVVVDYEGDHVLICKGAVEDMFKVCTQYQVDDEIHPLIDMIRQDVLEDYEALSADGYRVLAIAYREFPRDKKVFSAADESDMILLGYIAFFDPPKESTAKALKALEGCRGRGEDPHRGQRPGHPQGVQGRRHRRGAPGDGAQLVGLSPEQLIETGGERHGLRAAFPHPEGADHPGPPEQGARGGVPRGRHQRRARAQEGGRRHLRGHGGGRGQGSRGHRPAGEEPPRPG